MNPLEPENKENKPSQEPPKAAKPLPDTSSQQKPKKRGGIDRLVMSLIIGAAVGSVVGVTVNEEKKRGLLSGLKNLFKKGSPKKTKKLEEERILKRIPDESK